MDKVLGTSTETDFLPLEPKSEWITTQGEGSMCCSCRSQKWGGEQEGRWCICLLMCLLGTDVVLSLRGYGDIEVRSYL